MPFGGLFLNGSRLRKQFLVQVSICWIKGYFWGLCVSYGLSSVWFWASCCLIWNQTTNPLFAYWRGRDSSHRFFCSKATNGTRQQSRLPLPSTWPSRPQETKTPKNTTTIHFTREKTTSPNRCERFAGWKRPFVAEDLGTSALYIAAQENHLEVLCDLEQQRKS